MNSHDFNKDSPGDLVPTDDGAMAFVPDPLPTSMDLPADTIRILTSAERELGRLAGTAAREFNPYLVGSPLLHREAILSSRMEGTMTTPEQLVLLQVEPTYDPLDKNKRDTQEVLNYMDAMKHGLNLLQQLPVCLRLIREVHRELLQGVRGAEERPGEFRTSQNWIKGRLDKSIHNARFVPPPVPEMEACLNDFESYLNTETGIPGLVKLALGHYQFETIHPFRDGNGRVGRLLIPLLLCEKGRLDTPILYASAYFERNREQYVDLLLYVSQTGDWMPWINFFLRAVFESAEESTRQATALLNLRHEYHARFQTSRSSALLLKLVDQLFQVPSITRNMASEALEITHQAASKNIMKLVEAEVLREVTGRSRYQIFVADEIMNFMVDSRGDQ